MSSSELLGAALAIFALAFFARTAVLLGREPGGVDAWYYLAYARAFRRKPGLRVDLPEYLLQDTRQSYAPVFPSLLGFLPEVVRARSFWAISPAIDCLTLLLLFLLALKLTAAPTVALVASLAYAVSPTMVSETRALSPRSFGVFLQALSLVFLLRANIGPPHWWWTALALLSGALLILSSATATASYFFVAASLSLAFRAPHYALVAVAALGLAWLVAFDRTRRMFENYVEAVKFWRRNRPFFGSHPILDSPVYGGPRPKKGIGQRELGFLGQSLPFQLLRLLGENPFFLALFFAPSPFSGNEWTRSLFVWSASLSAFAVISTVVWPLRAFGPGRSYMKSAIFPTAYVLAAGIGTSQGLSRPIGLATLAALLASVLSILFFLWYTRRKKHEHTAHVPRDLRVLVEQLAGLPPGGVACLPGGYSDYVTYQTERAVLWGGHNGSLDRFEMVSPVYRERVETLSRRYGVRFLIVERSFLDPVVLSLDERCALLAREGEFDLYDLDGAGETGAT